MLHYKTTLWCVLLMGMLCLLCATSVRAAPLPQEGDDATLRVINESEETICYVYICATIAESTDSCLFTEIIEPGESHVFDLAPGYYNLGLVDCKGNVLLTEPEFTITTQHEVSFTGVDPCGTFYQKGMPLYNQGKYSDAIEEFEKALTCYQQINDRKNEGTTLNFSFR